MAPVKEKQITKLPSEERGSTRPSRANVRPPVIVVMGHIDHGKSTLLDYIRKSDVAKSEAGGITQHVGAYETIYKDKQGVLHRLTFLDTPGHEAFCGIRERGAQAADLAILVVSGEDGVKPQTLEALKCLQDGKVPFVVAINKIDKPGVDVERIKGNLAENEVYVEGYGGDISIVAVSALTGKGVPELLELLILMAELQELKCDTSKKAEGIVIEAHLDNKKGITATLIIKDGTLSVGEFLTSGNSFSSVRSIENYEGVLLPHVACGSPVRIVGWNTLPIVGNIFSTVTTRNEAEEIAKRWSEAQPKMSAASDTSGNPNVATIPIVIKADTAGSLEAMKHEMEKIRIESVKIKILLEGVGPIGENDLKTAAAGKSSLVLGFNVKVHAAAKGLAERLGVTVMVFDIIYRLTEWLTNECQNRKPRTEVEENIGQAKILKLFSAEKGKFVLGGRVESGTLKNSALFKIMRRDIEIGRGKIRSLQQQKQKAEEVAEGKEFGAMIESRIEPAPGDRLEAFVVTLK